MSKLVPATAGVRAGSAGPGLTGQAIKRLAIKNAMVIVMMVIAIYFFIVSPRFLTVDNLQTILIAAAPFALIAFGQTLVILTGGIDLSVGSVIALSAMVGSLIAVNTHQIWLALVGAIAVGVVVGSVNGFLVSVLRVPPFVATLGMLTTASGFAYVVGGGAPINGVPREYGVFANTKIIGLQLPVIIMVIGFIVLAVIMRKTTYGIKVYAVGGNQTAAQIAGIKVPAVLFSVYAISGALAGLSGLLLSSRVISGMPTLGDGYELDAIAAVVIGGASLMGGRGTLWGTAIGLLLIQTLNNGLDILLVPAYWQSVIKGALIIAAVAVDVYVNKKLQ